MSKRPREEGQGPETGGGDTNEVSLSVEETNKLRADLGLKPLEEGKKDVAKENWLREEAERVEKASSDALAKKLEKVKNKRELNKKSNRKSIAEQLRDTGEDLSAAEWIKHNRKKVSLLEKQAAAKAAQLDQADEEAYETADLAGLTVAHSADEFKDGSTVILTLKDESILEGTGDQVHRKDATDELENVGLVDVQVAKRNNKRKAYSGAPGGGYNPFDDHEFNEDGTVNTNKRSILEKYDDDHERNRASLIDAKKKITITGEGEAKVAGDIDMAVDGEEDEQAARAKKKIAESLQVKFQAIKEQYTSSEVAAFNKPEKKMRKKKKMRNKKETIEWDAAPQAGVVSKDHGSREASTKAKQEELSVKAKLAENSKKYTKALSKAYDKSQKLLDDDDDDLVEEDELQAALDRARRLGQAKPKQSNVSDFMVEKSQQQQADEKPSSDLVLTGTIEFCRGIQQAEEPENKTRAEVAPESKVEGDEDKGEMDVDDEEGANNDNDSEDEGFANEKMLGRGLGGALDMIRNRGAINDSKEAVLGRNDDEKHISVNEADDGVALDADGKVKSKFRLEYRDKYGRLLSQKEAFRQLSYGFHGKGPGKSKIEARQRKLAEQQRLKKVAQAGETPTTMLALGITQKKTKQAHMVIGGQGL